MLFARNPPRPMARKGCQYVVRKGDSVDGDGREVLRCGERTFPVGGAFPYAELGLHELEAYKLHRAGVLEPAPVAVPDGFIEGGSIDIEPGDSQTVTFRVDPSKSERVEVTPPRHHKRRR